MTATQAILQRRSIRKFVSGAEVTDAQVKALLTAAMVAPSACNSRPWEFIVIRDRAVLERIRTTHPYTGMLASATLAIAVIALPETQDKQEISRGYYPQDCGAVTQNILISAVEQGLGACWCGVYPKENRIAEMREILQTEKLPFCVIAIGVPDENPDPRGGYDEAKVTYL
ncbi:MAG: nitroreductase family protein [Defluviitaleaceae bacterium]|nr:nitroreductase family protein [Defluviitaleaceae bacterium]